MLEQHLVNMNLFWEQINLDNLKIKVSKCAFAQKKVVVLDFISLKEQDKP